MIDCFLSMDFGTQGVRVSLIEKNGILLATAANNYQTFFPRPGWAEQNPHDWVKALRISLKELFMTYPTNKIHILSCSVSATSSTVLPIDNKGNPLDNALLWMDCRATEEAEIINSNNYEVVKYSGGEVSTEWLIPKVMWFKKNNIDLYEKTYRFVEELDYINFILTGTLVSSFCNMTCKGNYVDDLGGWNEEYFTAIGLSDFREKINTEVVKVGGFVGYLTNKFSKLYNIDYKIPVFQGCIDAYSGMIGLGVVSSNKLATVMGTSFVELCLDEKNTFHNGLWGPYKNALIDGYSVYEGGQVSAGSIAKWFKNLFNEETLDFDKLSKEARNSGINSNGVMVLDFFQGNRTPYKNTKVRGEIKNLSLNTSRGDIYRAILESVAFGLKNTIIHMENSHRKFDSFVASGGVTKDPLWMEIISDVCAIPISLVNSRTYSGLMGSAIISSVSLGINNSYEEAVKKMIKEESVIEPNLSNSNQYQETFLNYIELCKSALNER